MATPKKEDFDSLECPRCDKLTKPKHVNADGSVRYECTNYKGHECCQGDLGAKEAWTIMEDGSMKG